MNDVLEFIKMVSLQGEAGTFDGTKFGKRVRNRKEKYHVSVGVEWHSGELG